MVPNGLLTVGKVRGLQQISTAGGVFVICAMDHRGSMEAMINSMRPGAATHQEMVRRKTELCSFLGPLSSAVLLDPVYGAAQCIASGVLGGSTGLLVSIETSGYGGSRDARVTTLLDGWGVDKIKRMGASAVKILLYYRPDTGDLGRRQQETVKGVAEECRKADIPLLVESVSYRAAGETDAILAAKRPELVIETARHLTSLPVDVLKAEFPADMGLVRDEGRLLELCRRLDGASRLPWVLLSGGATYDVFLKQVEIACRAGASGFLGGRAIWQEAVGMMDASERVKYLSTVAADRLKRLVEVTARHARPWYAKLDLKPNELAPLRADWYRSY